MSDLFAVLPRNLFNPLAARHAPLYSAVLLTLYAETQRHHQPLSRELAQGLVAEVIEQFANEDLSDLPGLDEVSSSESDPSLARSGAVLRYLAQCGWLRIETQSDFRQSYTLPDFAFRLLATFQELADNEPLRLQGLICAIHDMLQMAVREGTAHIRLVEAHRQTRALMNGLKELQHNIGLHIEQVLRQLSASAVLAQIFTSYRNDVVDRAYHQLRTTDHVSRFRPGVLEALTVLGSESQLHEIARLLRASGDEPSVEAAATRLLEQIREVREQFEGLDRLIQLIDLRHSQFVDSAVRTVELQLAASTTTSGQLHAVLTSLLDADAPAGLAAEAEQTISLFGLGLLDEQSLTAPARATTTFVPAAPTGPRLSEAELTAARERTLRQLTRSIGRERIRRFAAELLAERSELRAAEIALASGEELPLVIYVRHYGDGSLGYQVEELRDAPWVERDGVGFRDFIIRRVS
ncbi:MAG: Wadjet anti-phage system protein JetA family protein [Oscillochloridaceae bacterium umkhey_bin13]